MAKIEITNAMKQPKRKVLFPLGLKLALIVALILMGSIWAITSLTALMVTAESVRTAENINSAINTRAASGIEDRLYKIRSDALLLLDMISTTGDDIASAWQLRNIFFERNPNIAAVIVPGAQSIGNQQFFTTNEISQNDLDTWLAKETRALELAKQNVPVLRNVTPELGISLLALFYPWQSNGVEDAAVVFFSPQNLLEITAAGFSSTMVVNGDGDVLVHPDFSQVQTGANISGSIFFEALKKNPGETIRISYSEGKNRIMASGCRISFADVAVFSTLEYSFIAEQLTVISRRNLLLSLAVLSLAFLVTWFFSKSITNPLKRLTAAAGRIKSGEFYLDLKPKSRDEIGVLTERFIEMGQGLSQWEEVRDLVGRYNSRATTDMAMRGELNFQGEHIQAVILSVDLLLFPVVSRDMTAKDSLELLNSFIAKMMNCVEKTGGVVDKIMGRRMIALWGVPSSSGHFADEVMKSINSVLLMRNIICEINAGRGNSGHPLIQMNCGIHSGEVLAGRIGASQYNRYSVIGKNVDVAVNCGEACDLAETDIIISSTIQDMVASRIIAEKLALRQFGTDLRMFGLVNLVPAQGQENHWPLTLNDVRHMLGKVHDQF